MTSMSHEPATSSWPTWRKEMWASLAIAVVWLSVLFTAVWGPDIVSSEGAGTNTSTVPSAIVVAVAAFFATWVIAKYAYGRSGEDKR
jgi:membrane protein YdbS with pleckstrin-like domain